MSKKVVKYVLNILFLLLIIAGTFYLLLRNQEIDIIMHQIRNAKKSYLLAGVGLLGIFVCSESVIICQLLNAMSYPIRFFRCFLLSCIGFFFSSITPGASGGQPVQIYYMTQCGVDMFVGTLSLMVVTVVYKLALLLLCAVFAIFEHKVFMYSLSKVPLLFVYGLLGNLLFLLFLVMIIFKPRLAVFLVNWLINLLSKFRFFKHPEKLREKAVDSMNKYTKGAEYIKNHIMLVPRFLIITLIQRLSYFSVAYMVYRSFGLRGTSYTEIITLQIVLSLAVDVLPLPGAAGANENVFMHLYRHVFGMAVVPALLICRGITYYVLLLATALITCFAHFYLARKKRKFTQITK